MRMHDVSSRVTVWLGNVTEGDAVSYSRKGSHASTKPPCMRDEWQ